MQNWTDEIFQIIRSENRNKGAVIVHYLADEGNIPIQGAFYDSQLNRVNPNTIPNTSRHSKTKSPTTQRITRQSKPVKLLEPNKIVTRQSTRQSKK